MSSKYSRKKEEKPNETVPILQLFQFASKIDIIVILIATATSIVSGAIQPLSIIFFGDVLKKMGEAIINRKDIVGEAMPVVKIYVYMGIGVMVASYVSNCLWILAGESQTRRIRQLYVHSILRQEMSWFDKADEGSLSTRLAADIVLVQEGISEKFGEAVMGISQFIAGIVVAFYKGWKLAIVMTSVAPIIILSGAAMGYSVSKYTVLAQNAYAEAGAVAEQVFAGIRTVYSFSLQKRFCKTYDQKLVGAEEAAIKRGKVLGAGLGVFLFSVMGMYGLSFWYGARMVRDHKMDGSTVLVVFLSMVMGELSLMNVPNHLAAISAASAAAYKIFHTIHRVPSIDSASFKGKRPLKITGDIEFSNIRFCYPTRPDTIILKNLNLKIKAGMTVAFVGPSGSGKSTSVALIQRFYDPLSGTVTLDGVNLKDYNVKILREHIGVVSQEPVLFNTSIKENIMMGSPERNVGIKEIIAVCKKANCHSFIKQLPHGYDTLVGEHGGMLSGGQKQRIAIARAILKNPAILLLDEATSALDTQSERLVQAALDEASANRTTIIVAHRLSTVRNADLIVVMDKGDLVEQGTHNELLALGGVYSELVRKQKIDTVDDSASSLSSEQGEKEALIQHEALAVNRLSALSSTNSDTSSDFSSIINMRHSTGHKRYSGMDGHEAKRRREQQEKQDAKKMKAPVTRVLKDMRGDWKFLALGILGAILAGVAFPLYSLFFSNIITILIDNDDRYYGPLEGPNRYAFLFFILGLMALFGFYLQVGSFEYAGAKYTTSLRSRLFAAYIKQEIGFFDRDENNVGSLTAKLATECKNVNELITKVWGDFAHAFVTVFTGLAIAFAYSWKLTLIVMCMMPVIAFATGWQQKIQREFEDNTKDNGNSTAEVANEAIKQIRTVTALNKQLHFEEKYYKATEEIHAMSQRRAYLSSIGFALLQSSSLFANAIGFFAGAKLIVKEQLVFKDMIVALTSVIILSESLGRASVFITTYTKAKIAAVSVYRLLDRKSSIDPELEGIEPSNDDIAGAIDFSGIKFRYPARPDVPIFNGKFNLKGKAGQTIALVGPSGCGKSTTIGMLQRWYDPLKGTVKVDNHNVKSFTLKNLRSHMALVGQEPVLFDVSIGDNIRFGVDNPESVTLDQIKEVCRAANIHTFIKGLPDGYNTRVGDKGSQLSGGQKQRIAIARALLRKPKILLLDEATSALDSESEKLVQQALDKILEEGGRTTITIAHRLSTITNSDLICVIKDSRVIEQGTHWELLKLNGVYTELVNQQSLTST